MLPAAHRSVLRLVLIASILLALTFSLASCSGGAPEETAEAEPAPATIDIPDVTGQAATEGKRTIERAGPELTVEYEDEPENEDNCTVSHQDETNKVLPDATVLLTLECQVEVPDVTDDGAITAKKAIEDAGLGASYDSEPDDAAACTVTDQDPAAEELVDESTDVTLTLDCGVEVPDVTGEDADSAKSTIEESGDLTAGYDVEPEDPTACTVGGQDPAGGESVDAGTDVTLTLECEEPAPDDGGGGDTNCEPGYDPCLDADSSDYDCEGGEGDGPDYTGLVTVTGGDRFELDDDGDGTGCDQ
jgi:hypothetical protein